METGTILRDVEPDTVAIKGILIGVKGIEIAPICRVHGRVLLMAKDDSIARSTFSLGLAALTTDWLLFVAFELAAAASQASSPRSHCVGILEPRISPIGSGKLVPYTIYIGNIF